MPDPTRNAEPLAALYAVPVGLLLKRWGESADLVFHPGLNSTHLIDQDAGSLLARLQLGPACFAELASLSDADRTQMLLQALLQAGLVQAVAS
jgi:hypothetical protein